MEKPFEPNYTLNIGDVALIKNKDYGFIAHDIGKYAEVVGKGDYFGRGGIEVKLYGLDDEFTTASVGNGTVGVDNVVGYESFGENPLILLNTLDIEKDTLGDVTTSCEAVHAPKHYDVFDGTEAIEIIASSLTQEEFRGYCFGNLLKYRLRCGKKDDVMQELNKADKYKELYENYKYLSKG